MDRNEEIISKHYEALMFARSAAGAEQAARQLAGSVLGEEGLSIPLERAMKEVCRRIRPASDPRDQARFEAEFLELVFAPSGNAGVVTSVTNDTPRHSAPSRSKAA